MKLDFHRLDLSLANPWAIARTEETSTLPVVIVRLTADDGTVGLGEASPAARYQESVDTVLAFGRKIEPAQLSFRDIAASMDYLETLSPADSAAKCAFSIALHDGAAKRSKQPLHDFLCLPFLEGHYTTSFSIGIDTVEVIQRKTAAAAGFPVLKLKMGVAGDEARFRSLRETAPSKVVRVDANEGWRSREEALRRIEWLAEDGRVEFVEQPLPASAPVEDWLWLKERSPLPVFADESFHRAADVDRAAACFHGVNVKLVKTGGIAAAVEALRAARKAGLKTMLGCMIETSVLISSAAHLADLADYFDLDGNLLITNDPFAGATAPGGVLSFGAAPEPFGLRVRAKG